MGLVLRSNSASMRYYMSTTHSHSQSQSQCSPCPLLFQSCSLPQRFSFKMAVKRVRCELQVKVNGALSADSDPLFLDRQKALEAAMNDINSSFGKGSVTRLGSAGGALVYGSLLFPSCFCFDWRPFLWFRVQGKLTTSNFLCIAVRLFPVAAWH